MATTLTRRRNRPDELSARREDWLPSLWRDMDRFMRSFDLAPFTGLESMQGEFLPSVDVSETDKEVKVSAELPGMSEDDIDVTVSRDSLTIKGEKKQESEEEGKDFYRMERRFGSFQRTIPLTTEVDENKADAKFKNGVLEVRLPKTEDGQRAHRKVKVKGE